ncbi:hypothetical protein L7F22_032307 [Adiantum nelumboides]|nr:hypothetical protein [Adiantum nelumboides]
MNTIHELRPSASNGAEYVGFEFSSSFDSVEERMLPADELFCDGKLRPLCKNFEWWVPTKRSERAHLQVFANSASCLSPSPTLSTLPSVSDAAAAERPEAGPFGSSQTAEERTNELPRADADIDFNSSEWICFSPSPTFFLQTETYRKSGDLENMVSSSRLAHNGYSYARASHAEERACLSPLPVNCSFNGPDGVGQGQKPEKPPTSVKQAFVSAEKGQQNIRKCPSSNRSVAQAMAITRACRIMDASRGIPKHAQSNLPVAANPSTTPQDSCLLTYSTSSSSSISSLTSTSSTTSASHLSMPVQSSSAPSALVSSLLSALSSMQSSEFLTSPSSPPFSPSASNVTPSSPPFSAFTTSAMPSSSCSSSSAFYSDIAKKHPSLSSPSTRSTYCSCSCRLRIWSLWPFSKYKESIYSHLESLQFVSSKPQEIGSKPGLCLASKDQSSSLEWQVSSKLPIPLASHYPSSPVISSEMFREMQHFQHTKSAIPGMYSKQSHPASNLVDRPSIVKNEQRQVGECSGRVDLPIKCDSTLDGYKSSPTHTVGAKKKPLSKGSMVMQMGFGEYTKKKGTYSPTVRVTPILSIVPGCIGPSLSKIRPSTTKPGKASL